jgi:succinate dehydrogenase flavin-adding protein (antitoxin of CptAB toxin-antitoxin module)
LVAKIWSLYVNLGRIIKMNDKQYNELMTSLDRVESQLNNVLNSIKILSEIKYEIIKKRHAHTKYVKFKKMNVSMKGEYKILLNELDDKLVAWTNGTSPNARNEYYNAKENLFYFKKQKHEQGYDI